MSKLLTEPGDYIAIEHHKGKYMLSYTVKQEVSCPQDKTKVREILIDVIDNFNTMNPDYIIEYTKLVRPIPEVIID